MSPSVSILIMAQAGSSRCVFCHIVTGIIYYKSRNQKEFGISNGGFYNDNTGVLASV